ncbi:hypothetical protein IHQ71_24395 [Rhizobium sp. TH2]|uniref:hypothetical protein n=1 Tax=Rhizobium sp. TH2 TaxID=2775403 RepID=UPI00215821FC|nr:hypothetical protein [Rhizobium sp. TH2]UVC08256.1 hypothetical protein IHQ71_24395 [Rhizobium sp. TH2]
MILALYIAQGWVSYSRNGNFYVTTNRYKSELYSRRKVIHSADYLVGLGLAYHDKAKPGTRGWQSALKATPGLVERTRLILEQGPPLKCLPPAESIILRDKDGDYLDYRDSGETRLMRKRLAELNEQVRGTLFTGVIPSAMVRIFNRTFDRGGRFYALGGSWQSMPKEARMQITIAGEPVSEIDYKTLHPAMLYAQVGSTLPEDCYNIQGWPRNLVKVALLILVNSKNKHQARYAVAHHEHMRQIAERGSQPSFTAADHLMAELRARHGPISHAFHSDKGAELMRMDSDMAEAIMHIMMMAGITVLPVHDSFLVQRSHADQLERTMFQVAYEAGFEALRVEPKY